MEYMLRDAFDDLLQTACTPQVVRAIESGADDGAALWALLDESGFLAALEPEAAGGAGLGLASVFDLLLLAGGHALPLPFAQTLLARGWLAAAGIEAPAGRIAFAPFVQDAAQGRQARVAGGAVADWVLAADGEHARLLATDGLAAEPDGVHASLAVTATWQTGAGRALALPALGLRELAGLSMAVSVAGAAERVLAMAVAYARERQQFGRPIGKFQAIQHELAVMAQEVGAMRIAAEQACQIGLPLAGLPVCVAAYRNAAGAAPVSAAAHAIHGAIGVTAELDLNLYTRRLLQWQGDAGSAAYWAQRIGSAALHAQESALDFLRTQLIPQTA
ncbi:acyl-CoA dehydrogenase [Verticiella sediminum]|uniref:Acyl-CoA dehydrogenase n=1 Tax=Verticiella sediminum TaxID=1247510 RepID=A0A556AYC3_9BURK|nr:acyl-CoA dehydrogenase family protein [Verticiella sediminum]TSH97954.1 acyl-CoA dehydrogenase [Verticiella sediminum]